MKKSKSMRVALILFILTSATTCFYSGTLAKYTTTSTASDSARVAKWGITASVEGDLFGDKYSSNTGNIVTGAVAEGDSLSVKISESAAVGDKIVAPGTNNGAGITIKVSGTPEVATKLTWKSVGSVREDIYLSGARGGDGTQTYAVLEKVNGVNKDNVSRFYYMSSSSPVMFKQASVGSYDANTDYYMMRDKVKIEERSYSGEEGSAHYYPVKWTLAITDLNGTDEMKFSDTDGMLSKIHNYMAGKYDVDDWTDDLSEFSTILDANTSVDFEMNIIWEWDFEDSKFKNMLNGADTILGSIAAHEQQFGNEADLSKIDWFVVTESADSPNCYRLPVNQNDVTGEDLANGRYDYNLEVAVELGFSLTQID